VISTIITQSETVIRIEPPRNEAAPSKAYLALMEQLFRMSVLQEKNTSPAHTPIFHNQCPSPMHAYSEVTK
jgi:hypothetical protein